MHHGNGTQSAFYKDASVLFISLHQNKNFPIGNVALSHIGTTDTRLDTGMVEENGEGQGEGFNINIPLPPGSGYGAYDCKPILLTIPIIGSNVPSDAFEEVVVPALDIYKPELILVSSGFGTCLNSRNQFKKC